MNTFYNSFSFYTNFFCFIKIRDTLQLMRFIAQKNQIIKIPGLSPLQSQLGRCAFSKKKML